MTDREIELKVREIIAQKFSLPLEQVTPESRLVEDLKIDSFGALEIMFEIEESFGLTIPDADIQQVRSVKDVTVYITEWLLKKPPLATGTDAPIDPYPKK